MRTIIALCVLIALAAGLRWLEMPTPLGARGSMLLGFVVLAAHLAGIVAARAGFPRVTGYVVLGILAGPFALGVLRRPVISELHTIDNIALALIALTAGGELKVRQLRQLAGPILGVSAGVFVVVAAGIAALVLLARPIVPFLAERPLEVTIAIALLLGIWCANSAPDATIAVINETSARGTITELILGVTIFKDVLVIIAFAVMLSAARSIVNPEVAFDASLLGSVTWEVGGALLVGALTGWGFAGYLERFGGRVILATLIFAYVVVLLAEGLHVELLLMAVAAGFVIENFSNAGARLLQAIEANALLVFALFFAVAGATLDLNALAEFWPIAIVVVLVRTALTWFGARLGASISAAPPGSGRLAWLGLISQAGVTLGLAVLVHREFPTWGQQFAVVAAAIIIFHLLLGPILLKQALVRAGEAGAARPQATGRQRREPSRRQEA